MEFPHIGKNCTEKSCNKLDFLPMKCDACHGIFCSDHFNYLRHECPSAYKKDVQVPECPLCGTPVPGKRGEAPDVAVGAHIDNDCQADHAKKRRNKVFTNKCAHKGCKGKEMVPLVCSQCSLNFCFKHRHTVDHACEGKLASKRRMAEQAALARFQQDEQSRPKNDLQINGSNSLAEVQGNMSEDEALARALALSMQDEVEAANANNLQARDAILARTLLNRQRVGGEQSSRCNVS